MPQRILEILLNIEAQSPYLFNIADPTTNKNTHVGIQDWWSEPEMMLAPQFVLDMIGLPQGGMVAISYRRLPRGKHIKIRPHETAFIENCKDPKAILEKALSNYQCLTKDDVIIVHHNNKDYKIDVTVTKPNVAIIILNTDLEVDFERPKDMPDDYEEKKKQEYQRAKTLQINDRDAKITNVTDKKFMTFTGKVSRLDGKAFDEEDKQQLYQLHDEIQKVDTYDPRKFKLIHGIRKKYNNRGNAETLSHF